MLFCHYQIKIIRTFYSQVPFQLSLVKGEGNLDIKIPSTSRTSAAQKFINIFLKIAIIALFLFQKYVKLQKCECGYKPEHGSTK